MKRAIIAGLGLYLGYLEFGDDLAYWLPAWGAVYGGQVIGQAVILGVLAAMIFGSVAVLGYRALGWLLD